MWANQRHLFTLMEPVISANDYTLHPQSRSCYKDAMTAGERKRLSRQTMGVLTAAVSIACDLKYHGVWVKRQTERPRKLRQLLGGPPARSGGCVHSNPLGSSGEAKGGMKEGFHREKQTSLQSQPLPKRPGCWGWDHTCLSSIYHFVKERPTTQETIKHCKRPRYQSTPWLLYEGALAFSTKSHYAKGEEKHEQEREIASVIKTSTRGE